MEGSVELAARDAAELHQAGGRRGGRLPAATSARVSRSRSRAAASARTRAGRAPASPGGSRACPRARRARRPRHPDRSERRPRRSGRRSRGVVLVDDRRSVERREAVRLGVAERIVGVGLGRRLNRRRLGLARLRLGRRRLHARVVCDGRLRSGASSETGSTGGGLRGRAAHGASTAPRDGACAGSSAGGLRRSQSRRPPRRALPLPEHRRRLAVERATASSPASAAISAVLGLLRHIAPGGTERLFLLALDLLLGHSVLALQLEMLPDGIVEYAHRAEPYRGRGGWLRHELPERRSTRFLPLRFAR